MPHTLAFCLSITKCQKAFILHADVWDVSNASVLATQQLGSGLSTEKLSCYPQNNEIFYLLQEKEE